MTVKELIQQLKKLPQNKQVVVPCYIGYCSDPTEDWIWCHPEITEQTITDIQKDEDVIILDTGKEYFLYHEI